MRQRAGKITTLKHGNMEKRTIILAVRVDYTHDGRDQQHAETAARMAITESFPTIENGVKVERVEVYRDGAELFSILGD